MHVYENMMNVIKIKCTEYILGRAVCCHTQIPQLRNKLYCTAGWNQHLLVHVYRLKQS